MIAAHTTCIARTHARAIHSGRMRSMKSIVTCSSACDTSGRPAKISTSKPSSVISNAPRIGLFSRERPTTSKNVRTIMPKRRADAAMPRTASARLSQTEPLFASSDLLQFLVEFVERLLGVRQLDARLLDPVVDDRAGALLRLGLHPGIRGDDGGAGGLQCLQADLVGPVPRLAVRARGILIGVFLDDRLVLLGDLVPLVLVHEEAERRAVQ